MARRSVLLVVALVIALVGTMLIVLYVRGIDARATKGQELVEVLVATEPIEAGESVSAAKEAGKFDTKEVRRDDRVEGALGSTTAINDLVALSTVYPGEQILANRFGSLGDSETLVIPDDKIAMSVELTDFERVAGFVNPGSEVAIFNTVHVGGHQGQPNPEDGPLGLDQRTQLLLTRVMVIGVGTTTVSARTTTTEDGAVTEEVPRTILTVAVSQADAEKLIWADRYGDLNFALLTEKSETSQKPGVRESDVVRN